LIQPFGFAHTQSKPEGGVFDAQLFANLLTYYVNS